MVFIKHGGSSNPLKLRAATMVTLSTGAVLPSPERRTNIHQSVQDYCSMVKFEPDSVASLVVYFLHLCWEALFFQAGRGWRWHSCVELQTDAASSPW